MCETLRHRYRHVVTGTHGRDHWWMWWSVLYPLWCLCYVRIIFYLDGKVLFVLIVGAALWGRYSRTLASPSTDATTGSAWSASILTMLTPSLWKALALAAHLCPHRLPCSCCFWTMSNMRQSTASSNQSQGHWRHAEAPLPAPGLLGPQKGEGNYLWQVSAVGRCGSRWGYLWQNGQRWVGGVGTMALHHSTRPTLYFGTSPPYTPSWQGQSSRPRCRAKSWMETACEEMAAGSSNHSTHRLGQELQAQGTWCPAWSCRT